MLILRFMTSKWAVNIILAELLLIIIGVIIWGINKGFDLTDEAFHVMMLTYPSETSPIMEYPKIFFPFFQLFSPDILGLRIIRLLLILVSSLAFSWGFWKWATSKSYDINFIVISTTITIGGMLCYSLGPIALSYNIFTLCNLQVICGLLFYFLSVKLNTSKKNRSKLALAAIGFCIIMQVFIKISTAMAGGWLIMFFLIIINTNNQTSAKQLLSEIACLLSGIVIAILYYWATVGSFIEWIANFREALIHFPGYDLSYLFERYTASLSYSFNEGIIEMMEIPGLVIVFVLSWRYLSKKGLSKMNKTILYIVFFEILLYIGYQVYSQELYKSGMFRSYNAFNFYLLMMTCITLIPMLFLTKNKISGLFSNPAKREVFFVALLLLSMPFVAAIGTNNPIAEHSVLYMTFWFALLLIITQMLSNHFKNNIVSYSILTLTLLVASSQIVHGYVFSPQRIPDTLTQQTEKIEGLKNADGILVDPRTKNFIEEIHNLLVELTNYQPKNPMISFNSSPGIVYLLDGITPGSAWYKPNFPDRNCFELQKTQLSNLQNTIVFLEAHTQVHPNMVGCMKEKGIDFPNNYVKIGEVPHYHYNASVQILVPKQLLNPKLDLYLLIGQSNMAGRGKIEQQDLMTHPQVFVLNYDSKWDQAKEPLHFDKAIAGTGPGLSFGKAMVKTHSNIYIGLIPCAVGETSVDYWQRNKKIKQLNISPYEKAIERCKIALRRGKLKGILWLQGESDSKPGLADGYEEKIITLVSNLRRDLGKPDLPFVCATLPDFFVSNHPEAEIVNDALKNLPNKVKNVTCISSEGLQHLGDTVHLNSASARELGRRFAMAFASKDSSFILTEVENK